MLMIGNVFGQVSQLFHSADIDELMDGFRPGDLGAMIAEAGLDPQSLSPLSPEQVIERLSEAGINTASLDVDRVPEQLQRML